MIKSSKKTKLQLILTIIVISSIFIIPSAPKSYEHAFVEKSDPAASQSLDVPPTKVDVYFSDPVDIRYSEIKVLDSDGKQIQENDQHYISNDQKSLSVSLPPNLKNGIYTISTKVLDQTDGHVTEDAFAFGVGQDVPKSITNNLASNNYQEVSIPEAVARFPSLLGQVIVAGIAASSLWLWGPISRIPRLKDSISQTRIKIDSAMAKMAVIGSIIILASGFAMIIVQAFSINAGILDAISTKFGNMWVLRMITASALLGLSFVIYQKTKSTPAIIPRTYTASLLGLSFSVLLTTSLISHGAATGQIIPLLLDFCHNVFASLWIGGIIYLAFVVMPQIKQITDSHISLSTILILIPRFSILVVAVLGAVVITGPFLLYALENNLALTLASFYGKVLIVKLGLAAAMIAFGGYHQVFVSNKAHAIISKLAIKNTRMQDTTIDAKPILSRFYTSIKIEAFIGIALIASVAVLVDSGLPSSEFQNQLQSLQNKVFALTTNGNSNISGLTQTGFVENGSRIVLSMSPFTTGNNDFTISFLDSNKNPIDMKSTQLELTQTDSGIGPITIDTNKTDTGTFTTNTDFGFPGHWTVRVEGVQNKENALNLVYSYDLFVKPKLNSIQIDIKEYKTPGNSSTPRYPVYDSSRNKIWVGDTSLNSGKILDFDLGTKKYTEHKIEGLNSIVYSALDSHDTLWYIDYTRKMLGHYNPDDNSNMEYPIPNKDFLTSMAIDSNDTIWITSHTNDILKFEPKTTKFDAIKLPDKSDPLGITIDNTAGKIWIAEGIGKLSSLDISTSKVTEFSPSGNYTMEGPTAIISDPETGKVYISEHEGHAVSVFDPLLKTFKKIQLDPAPDNLPYGMAFDEYHNLWVAQHTIDKISIIDPRTGDIIEKNMPSSNTWVQWLASDSQGNIIMAEERANALAIATISAGQPQSNQTDISSAIPKFYFDYAQVMAPSITGLLIVVAFFYCKGVIDLRNVTNQIRKTL
ncbi:putative Copper resistance family protein [Nitrosotalea devaniterrae]|uniref:Putative Copper resistance family protein n=1 Tax=Nitrosotalea devaniterrae TaxID=1078905 RepID=A0A128A452_9ARCH|nr:putative Copper resistance family protein [Candidatus Nitrosotalea devanaterra]